jgi:carbamoyl-phosphate synthase large subunit
VNLITGSQSARSIREEGIEVILIQNPATIMTDSMADHIYLKPLTTKSIIEIKSTSSNRCCSTYYGRTNRFELVFKADEKNLARFRVRMIGVDVNAINITEDRAIQTIT